MQAITVLFVVCALVGVCYAGLPTKDCGSTTISITNVNVFNSSWTCTKEPCPIIRGKDISVAITFKNNGDNITVLTNNVKGIVAGISLPFPGFPDTMLDVCKLGGSLECPIKMGETFTETATLPVIKEAPSIPVVAKWELHTTTMVACFEVALHIY